MNRRIGFWLSLLSPLCSLCLCGESAFAHPVPNTNHDRVIRVKVARDGVTVDYSLEVSPETATKELPEEDVRRITDYTELYPAYLKFQKPVLANNLDAKLDGDDRRFTCVESHYDAPANIYSFRYTAPWELDPGRPHRFTFNETNYALDDFSSLRVTLTADDSVTLSNVVAPDEALMAKPGGDRKPGEGDRLRKVSADVAVADGAATAAPPTAAPRPMPSTLLQLLLDTRQGWAVLMVLAAAFGAAHALTPGHGKTLVAAYLVGERGTVGHAVLLGVTTTLTHTAAVLVVAGLLPLFFPGAPAADVQRVLELTGGLLVAGLGVFLLQRRLTGGHDHVHIGGGHDHHHDGHDHHHSHDHDHDRGHHHHHHHGHVHEQPISAVTTTAPVAAGVLSAARVTAKGEQPVWRRLIVLGVSGGIVPCWDAIAMLAVAISAGRLWLGLPLLLAFSAGLAGVLVAIGVAVVHARNFAGKRWGGAERLRPVLRALPIASAVFITVMGLWLCYGSLHP